MQSAPLTKMQLNHAIPKSVKWVIDMVLVPFDTVYAIHLIQYTHSTWQGMHVSLTIPSLLQVLTANAKDKNWLEHSVHTTKNVREAAIAETWSAETRT